MTGWRKTILTMGAVVFLALGLRYLLAHSPNGQRPDAGRERSDMVAYWTAGRLFLHGGNPYDVAAVARIEGMPAGREWQALVMRDAPWTLPLVMPFGALSYGDAFYAWDFISIAAVLLAFALLARRYELKAQSWRGLLPFLFVPAYFFVAIAQTNWLVLLGLALFLYYEEKQAWAAGAGVFLATVKFNICFLFWPVLLLWILGRRRWRILGVALAIWTLAMAVALGWDHAVLAQYLGSLRGTHLAVQVFPNLLGWMRHLAGGVWPDFVFPGLGVVWAVEYYWQRRAAWQWAQQLPLIVLVSLVLAPYSFLHDELIATVAIMAAAAALRGRSRVLQGALLAAFVGAQVLILALMAHGVTDHGFGFAWTPLAWLGLYLAATRRAAPRAQAVTAG